MNNQPQGGADQEEKGRRRRWILKPSTLNKGAALALGDDFETLKDAIHESPDIREWVLQVRKRHKFTRAWYFVCSGTLVLRCEVRT